jgi:hypothetical protein
MQRTLMVDIYKFIWIKFEDFDEAMLIIQVWVGKFGMRDVILDQGSNVNIIS